MKRIFLSGLVSVLAVGTFVVGTDAFAVAGIFPKLITRFHVSVGAVGDLVTIFALTYALASPVLGAVSAHWDRRRVLVTALIIFTAGNIIAALSPDYGVMVIARVVAAIGAAAFTPNAVATAAMLSAPEARARAIARVGAGLTIATVMGVPAATILGTEVSFRWTFAAIAMAAAAAALIIRIILPAVPVPGGATLRQRIGITRTNGVLPTLLVSACGLVGGFTVYNYISPLFTTQLKIGASTIALLLFIYGIGGAAGNFLGGELADRIGANYTVAAGLVLCITGLSIVAGMGDNWAGAIAGIFIWGIGGWMLVPAQQHRLVSLAGPAAPLAISLNASAMYLGIGLAGLTGTAVIKIVGLSGLAPFAVFMATVSLAIVASVYGRSKQVTAADKA